MRAKTVDFLKVLNRARPEVKDKEKKTIRSAAISFKPNSERVLHAISTTSG
jgi:hypothetical protein